MKKAKTSRASLSTSSTLNSSDKPTTLREQGQELDHVVQLLDTIPTSRQLDIVKKSKTSRTSSGEFVEAANTTNNKEGMFYGAHNRQVKELGQVVQSPENTSEIIKGKL